MKTFNITLTFAVLVLIASSVTYAFVSDENPENVDATEAEHDKKIELENTEEIENKEESSVSQEHALLVENQFDYTDGFAHSDSKQEDDTNEERSVEKESGNKEKQDNKQSNNEDNNHTVENTSNDKSNTHDTTSDEQEKEQKQTSKNDSSNSNENISSENKSAKDSKSNNTKESNDNSNDNSNKTSKEEAQDEPKEKNEKEESEPKEDSEPRKQSGFDTALESEVNGYLTHDYNGKQSSLFNSLVTNLATGQTSSSSAKSQILGLGKWEENYKGFQQLVVNDNLRVGVFQTKQSDGVKLYQELMSHAGGNPGNVEWRKAKVYYDQNSKKYTVSYIILGFTYTKKQ
ncbi:hypothetical protein [Alkalibacillus almallahensis]|uniref:hypothetical protein n=1 Tax=Alkalibacillus almallahensis TaxID=1379154 RepID=UPI0014203B51|nr:hypothetical protein [Alkalibacillus almallahensis]NIK13443.1 hypothetical protein [Alkalibacillus almallahensis]